MLDNNITPMPPIQLTGEALIQIENKTAAPVDKPALVDRGGYTIEYKEYEKGSSGEGFGYNNIQYTKLEKAKELLGEEAVLACINRALTQALSIKAKSKLPELSEDPNIPEDKKKASFVAEILRLREETKGILLSEDEALKFVPGQREVRSVAGFLKEAKAAEKAGDKQLQMEYTKRAIELMQAELAKQAALAAAA